MSQAQPESEDRVQLDGEQLPVGPQLKLGAFSLKTGGLEVEGVPPIEEWEELLATLIWFSRNHPWWIGDLVRFGEARFGQNFYNALVGDATVVDMISRHAGVAKQIPPSQRDRELSWTHHREVVKLNPKERQLVFEYAKRNGIASGKMRKAVEAVRARRSASM